MRTLLVPFGLAALLLSPSWSAVAHAQTPTAFPETLSLEQALALAAERSPELAAASRELEAQEGSVQQAGALPNPSFNALMEDTQRATRTLTGTLDIPIELGGKRAARVSAAEQARALAQARLGDARSRLRAAVIAAWFQVLVAQERLQLADDSATLAARGADAVKRRVEAGKVSPVDGTRARVEAANVALERVEAQAQVHLARHALAALWGDATPRFRVVSGDIGAVPARGAAEDLLRALEQAPALRMAQIEATRRKALIEVEKGRGVPDLTLNLGVKRDNELGRNQAVIGFSMPLPVFDRNQGAVYEASKRADQAADEVLSARMRLAAELQQASTQLAVAQASLQALRDTVLPAAQEAEASASKGFEAGKFGFLDVVDARRALFQARARYLATLSTAYQAAAAIDRVLGSPEHE